MIEVRVRKNEIKVSGHAMYDIPRKGGYKVWESIGESKNSGGFLFCRHLYDR